MADNDSAGSRSIRALEVLEAIAASNNPATAGDIGTATGLPKATVHRLCNLLLEEGFLRRDLSGRAYEVGNRTVALSMKTVAGHGARGERHTILEALARDVGETCNITIPTPSGMYYMDRVESQWPLRIQLPTGSSVPIHCTASGKIFLASLSPAERAKTFDKIDFKRYSDNTITDIPALAKAIEDVARTGIGIDNEEFIPGMVAVAVPVTDASGHLVAALATHGPVVRLTLEQALSHVERMRIAATDLAATLQ